MILLNQFIVLVILGVLVSSSRCLEAQVNNAPCDVDLDKDIGYTVNCSRRAIDKITSWPERINDIDKDADVMITFFNNSIKTVTQMTKVPGAKIALSFKSNKIVEIEDDAFRNIEHLIYLDLSFNNITGEVLRSEIFQGPYTDAVYSNIALETLVLGYNEIHSLDRYLFKYTPNLTRLYLNNNPIEILDLVTILAISSATKLEVLDLSKTDIESIPLDAFRGLENLKQLDLSGNRFTTVPESLTLVSKTLEYLTFNNNLLTELNDDSFINLTYLKQLEVGENEYLEEVKRSTFSPLKNLKILHLCHNPNLRYISHNAFRGLKNTWTLKEVYLDENNLSELSTDLMPWSKVDILGMTGNKWLCNCDLGNIVTTQAAGAKFKPGEIPYCAAPMRMSGAYITNISLTFCPTLNTTFVPKNSMSISNIKPKHILWSIFGVAMIVCFGMLVGLLVNAIKAFYKKKVLSQPIRYVNLNSDSSFA